MNVNIIKNAWIQLEEANIEGIVKRSLGIPSCLKVFCTYKNPDRMCGLAFSFSNTIRVDLSAFKDLSELNISLFADASFPGSKLLLIQLANREGRADEIFASICGNLVNSVQGVKSEKEGVRIVVTQMRKWKDLFSRKKNKALSVQEQQGLYGELVFLKKLLDSSVDKIRALSYWLGPELSSKDFQSDLWAVEVKTVGFNSGYSIIVNGENQLDESSLVKLFLFVLTIESLQEEGQSLPELITDIHNALEQDPLAHSLFERKLLLAGYFTSDEDLYKDRLYIIRKESFYQVTDLFPRIKRDDLREGVFDVKYSISLLSSCDSIVPENNVFNFIKNYEGNKQVL
ncbi:MAG: PD-(D/E)XK motif protein [Bacteroidales bacterium]|nr:PD-(D/E)XK motif protein [Bacteroidales bacterium]